MDSLDQLSRYVAGSSRRCPSWAARIGRTPNAGGKAVREIAGELVQLYAARHSAPGFAFVRTPLAAEMEDGLRLTETVDQMTVSRGEGGHGEAGPMYRVIVGDVCYGKT